MVLAAKWQPIGSHNMLDDRACMAQDVVVKERGRLEGRPSFRVIT
jgi:hypothetical protein